MWFNSTQREEPYLGLTYTGNRSETAGPLRSPCTGAAWLSSARVVRCWVKSRNERNPYPLLPASKVGDSEETAGDKPEEGGDDVKSSWSLRPGLHTCYNGRHKALQTRKGEPIAKNRPQFRSRSATRPREGGIASNPGSARRGEYVPGPCTHRPSHHESLLYLKSLTPTARGQTPTV